MTPMFKDTVHCWPQSPSELASRMRQNNHWAATFRKRSTAVQVSTTAHRAGDTSRYTNPPKVCSHRLPKKLISHPHPCILLVLILLLSLLLLLLFFYQWLNLKVIICLVVFLPDCSVKSTWKLSTTHKSSQWPWFKVGSASTVQPQILPFWIMLKQNVKIVTLSFYVFFF